MKTIAAKQPAHVAAGDPAPEAPAILRTILGLINFGGYGGVIDNPSPGMAGPVRRPTTETVPTVRSKRVVPSRALFDAIYDAAKALETRPDGRRRIIFIVSDGQVTAAKNTHNFAEITDLLLRDNIELYCSSHRRRRIPGSENSLDGKRVQPNHRAGAQSVRPGLPLHKRSERRPAHCPNHRS
ncbi:MAG: hypothetical protein AUG08_09450 [Acidobacteria bacterium 13_1_20CM_2_55_15]|nr:MAG: hypothetical protein AUG08_09450 [Acidobacteria bacterium 13_1_20CM_2_55_15]